MRIDEHLATEAVMVELGRRLVRRRLELGLTQEAAARSAGLGKRTLERIEAGADCQVSTLLGLLRVLGLVEGVERLVPDVGVRPMDLLELKGRERQRAPRRSKTESEEPWRWGDEE